MKKKYRSLILILVILLCTLFGCHKEKTELLFEDTEKIIEEDPAGSAGNPEENQEAGRSVEAGEIMQENSGRNTLEESGTEKAGIAGEYAGSIDADTNANADINGVRMPEEKEETVSCMVHICGAVEQPGVYELPQGSRIYQAIECAGGLSDEADPDYLNQADFVSDGEKVYVPTREEVTTAGCHATIRRVHRSFRCGSGCRTECRRTKRFRSGEPEYGIRGSVMYPARNRQQQGQEHHCLSGRARQL